MISYKFTVQQWNLTCEILYNCSPSKLLLNHTLHSLVHPISGMVRRKRDKVKSLPITGHQSQIAFSSIGYMFRSIQLNTLITLYNFVKDFSVCFLRFLVQNQDWRWSEGIAECFSLNLWRSIHNILNKVNL